MKRTVLLNRHLSALVASLGHLDEIVIADAGLPVPKGVDVIDLAVSPRVPGFFEVLNALRSELVIEAVVWAEEAAQEVSATMQGEIDDWSTQTKRQIVVSKVPHVDFKKRTEQARAVIRTGEVVPYSNIILVSGVPF